MISHNTIELTGRIPEEWHQIASAPAGARAGEGDAAAGKGRAAIFRQMGVGYAGGSTTS
ncbi:MAG: hypothetical protein IPL38_11370 [Rhodobacter sp.]|nr:hypothetical protein [Rhodobacter sp.]